LQTVFCVVVSELFERQRMIDGSEAARFDRQLFFDARGKRSQRHYSVECRVFPFHAGDEL
jgi:hypothetical protein